MTSKERDAIWYVWQRTKSFDEEYAHIKKAYKNQGFFAEYDIAKFVAKKYPDMVEDIVRTAYATNFSGLPKEGYNNVSKADIAKEMKKQFPKLSETTIKELIDAYWGTITKALKSDKSAFIRINNIGSFRIITKKYNRLLPGKQKTSEGKRTISVDTYKVKFEASKNMENYVISGKDTTKKRTNSGKKSSKKASTSKSTTTTKKTTTKKTSTKSKSTRGKSKKTKSKNTKKH